MPTAIRGIPMSAQIYPRHLGLVYNVQAKTKSVTPIVVAAGLGYGAARYMRSRADQALAASQASEAARRREMSALMDAYGDKSSLASIEQASRVYENQQQRQRDESEAGKGR